MPKLHNPHNITPEQVEVSEGWRLLDEDEILEKTPELPVVEGLNCWLYMSAPARWSRWFCYKGVTKKLTYRTKLTRKELAKRRTKA